MTRSRVAVLLFLGVSTSVAPSAHAYLDPGSGSVVMQAIGAALISSALAIKIFWQRFKAFFSRLFSKPSKTEEKAD